MKTRTMHALMAVILFTFAASAAWGQATLARAEGKVRDGSKPLADVQVVLTYQDNGRTFKAKTDKSGAFSLIGLPRGMYTIEVFTASGDAIFREKTHAIQGEGGAVEKLDLDISGPGGAGAGQAKVSKEEVERIKAENAKATSLNALISQYNAAQAAQNWKEAEPLLKQMIAADPNNWRFYQALGTTQFSQGDYYQNLASGKIKPPENDTRKPEEYTELSQSEYRDATGSFDKGIQLAQGVLSGATPKDPNKPETDPAKAKAGIGQMLGAEGNAYLKLKKTPEAIAAFTKAAEMDPNPGVAFFNLCATQYNMGNTEGALAACDKAIAADPNKADAYFIKGSLMMQSSSMDKDNKIKAPAGTAETLNKYLELAPDGPHANDVKQMLEYIGSKVETTYKTKKK